MYGMVYQKKYLKYKKKYLQIVGGHKSRVNYLKDIWGTDAVGVTFEIRDNIIIIKFAFKNSLGVIYHEITPETLVGYKTYIGADQHSTPVKISDNISMYTSSDGDYTWVVFRTGGDNRERLIKIMFEQAKIDPVIENIINMLEARNAVLRPYRGSNVGTVEYTDRDDNIDDDDEDVNIVTMRTRNVFEKDYKILFFKQVIYDHGLNAFEMITDVGLFRGNKWGELMDNVRKNIDGTVIFAESPSDSQSSGASQSSDASHVKIHTLQNKIIFDIAEKNNGVLYVARREDCIAFFERASAFLNKVRTRDVMDATPIVPISVARVSMGDSMDTIDVVPPVTPISVANITKNYEFSRPMRTRTQNASAQMAMEIENLRASANTAAQAIQDLSIDLEKDYRQSNKYLQDVNNVRDSRYNGSNMICFNVDGYAIDQPNKTYHVLKDIDRTTIVVDFLNMSGGMASRINNNLSNLSYMEVTKETKLHELEYSVEVERFFIRAKQLFDRIIPNKGTVYFVLKRFPGEKWTQIIRNYLKYCNDANDKITYEMVIASGTKEVDDAVTVKLAILLQKTIVDRSVYILSNDKYGSLENHWNDKVEKIFRINKNVKLDGEDASTSSNESILSSIIEIDADSKHKILSCGSFCDKQDLLQILPIRLEYSIHPKGYLCTDITLKQYHMEEASSRQQSRTRQQQQQQSRLQQQSQSRMPTQQQSRVPTQQQSRVPTRPAQPWSQQVSTQPWSQQAPTQPWSQQVSTQPWSQQAPTQPWSQQAPTQPWSQQVQEVQPSRAQPWSQQMWSQRAVSQTIPQSSYNEFAMLD